MADSAGAFPAPALPPPSRQVRNPLSRTRVETAIARSAAGFGVAFFLQSISPYLQQASNLHVGWNAFVVPGLLLSLVVAGVASLAGRYLRRAFLLFPVVYLVGLISWPLAVIDVAAAPRDSFWLYFLLTVATVMAAIAFDLRGAIVYLIGAPTLYALIRVTPLGGDVGWDRAVLDSVYAVILGGFVTIVATILRDTASAVDRAQETALERYSHAVRQHATEAERVQVDAIVHDGVLTTLLAAARAYTPQAKELAATMAANTIGYLRESVASGPGMDSEVSGAMLAARIESAAAAMSQGVEVSARGLRSLSVPLAAAEAIYSATVQGIVNSLQHAGPGASRWVRIRGANGGIDVEIGDDGAGFDLAAVPNERLGVRVSILERLASAGGRAFIDSAPGRGTLVRLHWPDEDAVGRPNYDTFDPHGEGGEGTGPAPGAAGTGSSP